MSDRRGWYTRSMEPKLCSGYSYELRQGLFFGLPEERTRYQRSSKERVMSMAFFVWSVTWDRFLSPWWNLQGFLHHNEIQELLYDSYLYKASVFLLWSGFQIRPSNYGSIRWDACRVMSSISVPSGLRCSRSNHSDCAESICAIGISFSRFVLELLTPAHVTLGLGEIE